MFEYLFTNDTLDYNKVESRVMPGRHDRDGFD